MTYDESDKDVVFSQLSTKAQALFSSQRKIVSGVEIMSPLDTHGEMLQLTIDNR